MALWTPYAEQALDLTKNRRNSDVSEYSYSPEEDRCYNYVYGYTAPPQISPDDWNRRLSSPPHSSDSFEIDSLSDDVEYQAFERDALRAMAEKNGGTLLGNNPRMRRAVQTNQAADDSYRKQRERNNFAAKQSRDRRKLREVRLAFQVTFLKKKGAPGFARVRMRRMSQLLSPVEAIRRGVTSLKNLLSNENIKAL